MTQLPMKEEHPNCFIKVFSTLFALVLLAGTAQPQTNFGRTYTDSFPEKYKINVQTLKKHIYAGIPDKYKNEELKRKTYCFADRQAFFIAKLISSGSLYSDWPEFEDYINAVLKKITPKELDKGWFQKLMLKRFE